MGVRKRQNVGFPNRGRRARGKPRSKNRPELVNSPSAVNELSITSDTPSLPDVTPFLTVGMNATTRQLAEMANGTRKETDSNMQPFAVVFVFSDGQPEILTSHLPLLCKLASERGTATPETRLVRLQRPAGDRIAAALGVPRISALGLKEYAPDSNPLVTYVREHIVPLDVPWLHHATQGIFWPTRVKEPV